MTPEPSTCSKRLTALDNLLFAVVSLLWLAYLVLWSMGRHEGALGMWIQICGYPIFLAWAFTMAKVQAVKGERRPIPTWLSVTAIGAVIAFFVWMVMSHHPK